jgi:hypothetical protein
MNKKRFYAHADPNNPGKTPEQGANWQEIKEYNQKRQLIRHRKLLRVYSNI